ncbi:MAG TPA: hypothetical protein VMT19_04320 [Thermoanaerobaculaceae bacterium]|nr:hypothetical protein [Thermoanaerobaculaceae bacterium]
MRLSPRLYLALLVAVVLSTACLRHGWEGESDLVVVNVSQCAVTVSVDGWEATTVEPSQSRTVDNIGAGRHVIEVKDEAGRLIDRRYIDLASGEDYRWRIESCTPR